MSAERVNYISKEQFVKLRVDFVAHMDDIESFLDQALGSGLLIAAHRDTIMSQRNPNDQKRQLHDFILRKLPDASDKFISALKLSHHEIILNKLDDPSAYPMRFNPHGRVIVINNVKFDDKTYDERHGSEKDVEGIRKLFKAFNFDVQHYPNKTADVMKDIIEKEAKKETDCEDCFVMFLMSHGSIGHIIGTDGKTLSYSTINTILRESSQLKDKPKLIYINTCQVTSDKKDYGEYFNVPNLYVAFATVPENLAYRTEKEGSYFIESLLSVYERNKEKCDIFDLSPEINSRVAEKYDQISSSYSTLKKKLILRATD